MTRSLDERASRFVDSLSVLRFRDTFNPYADSCPTYDGLNAAAIRRRNLELVLDAALREGVDSLWVARDLGYRGGRRTGLPLTDEAHLEIAAEVMCTAPLVRATRGPLVSERTASVVWKMIRSIDQPVFLWNAFPLHPHRVGEPLSNRCHTRAERDECRPLLESLYDMLKPTRVMAIGRDAHVALTGMGLPAQYVRHPSYGGQSDFVREMSREYMVENIALRT